MAVTTYQPGIDDDDDELIKPITLDPGDPITNPPTDPTSPPTVTVAPSINPDITIIDDLTMRPTLRPTNTLSPGDSDIDYDEDDTDIRGNAFIVNGETNKALTREEYAYRLDTKAKFTNLFKCVKLQDISSGYFRFIYLRTTRDYYNDYSGLVNYLSNTLGYGSDQIDYLLMVGGLIAIVQTDQATTIVNAINSYLTTNRCFQSITLSRQDISEQSIYKLIIDNKLFLRKQTPYPHVKIGNGYYLYSGLGSNKNITVGFFNDYEYYNKYVSFYLENTSSQDITIGHLHSIYYDTPLGVTDVFRLSMQFPTANNYDRRIGVTIKKADSSTPIITTEHVLKYLSNTELVVPVDYEDFYGSNTFNFSINSLQDNYRTIPITVHDLANDTNTSSASITPRFTNTNGVVLSGAPSTSAVELHPVRTKMDVGYDYITEISGYINTRYDDWIDNVPGSSDNVPRLYINYSNSSYFQTRYYYIKIRLRSKTGYIWSNKVQGYGSNINNLLLNQELYRYNETGGRYYPYEIIIGVYNDNSTTPDWWSGN